jgi:SNF2 family DNA or RNA helicase
VRPNYLGDSAKFNKQFTEPIKKGQEAGASRGERRRMAVQLSILQDLTEVGWERGES